MNDLQIIASTLEKIKVMQAFCDGKKIIVSPKNTNALLNPEYIEYMARNPYWDWNTFNHTIAPTPKLRAWTIDEVPLNAWYRRTIDRGRCIRMEAFDTDCINVKIQGTWYNTKELQSLFEHSLDRGKTWHPCGKEEV